MNYIPPAGQLFIVAFSVLMLFGFWALYAVTEDDGLEDF